MYYQISGVNYTRNYGTLYLCIRIRVVARGSFAGVSYNSFNRRYKDVLISTEVLPDAKPERVV